jgi:hypothetical protein
MYEKCNLVHVLMFLVLAVFTGGFGGCASQRSGGTGGQGYIKPQDGATAKFGIDERISGLEAEIASLRTINNELGNELASLKSGIGEIAESCESALNAGGRSGDALQAGIEQMESLRDWVVWAYNRLNNLADTAQEGEINEKNAKK